LPLLLSSLAASDRIRRADSIATIRFPRTRTCSTVGQRSAAATPKACCSLPASQSRQADCSAVCARNGRWPAEYRNANAGHHPLHRLPAQSRKRFIDDNPQHRVGRQSATTSAPTRWPAMIRPAALGSACSTRLFTSSPPAVNDCIGRKVAPHLSLTEAKEVRGYDGDPKCSGARGEPAYQPVAGEQPCCAMLYGQVDERLVVGIPANKPV